MDLVVRKHDSAVGAAIQHACLEQRLDVAVDRFHVAADPAGHFSVHETASKIASGLHRVTFCNMPVLADLLYPDVRLVVCGSAAGERSAAIGAYYAGPGNQFWDMLYRVGVTPRVLKPAEFMRLQEYGIGLTDLAKDASGPDSRLRASDYSPAGLRTRIEQAQPVVLAFNGKRAAQVFLGSSVGYGYQPGCDIGRTRLHVAPSTSGAARGSWNEAIWREAMAAAGLHTVAIATQRPAIRESGRGRHAPRQH